MAMAAGKSAGKPPRMTDKAFKPPTEAAMAMTGNERLTGTLGFCFMSVPARGETLCWLEISTTSEDF